MPRRARVRAVLPRLLLLSLALLPSKGERNESSDAAPCPTHLSIAIPDGESHLLGDGSLAHGERVYPAGSHWREAAGNGTQRGCICLLAPSPCLRKCCGPGELVAPTPSLSKLNQCVPAANASESAALGLEAARVSPEMRRRLVERPDLRDWFALFESPSCADEYVFMDLNPGRYPEDEYLLQENGSIWVRAQGLLPIGRFCVDRQAGSKDLAVLACLRRDVVPEEETPTAVKVGYLLSIPFLVVTFFVYAIIPELRNIYGKTLMCYVASLLMAYSSISITHFFTFGTGCHVTAYIVHFSFLASFFWLNVMCFDIWWTFGGFRSLHGSVKQRERKKFIMYSIYAWGCASILTIVCMIMDLVPGIPESIIRPEFGVGSCWFNTHEARAIYFYGPMGVTVLCNICLFVLTALKILRHKKDTARQLKGSDSRRHDDNKQWFNLYLKLFIVMGINWSMEIVSWLCMDKLPAYVFYITDLTNTLQGVIIFVIFVWKDKIKRLLMKRFGCQGNNFLSRNSTSRSGCPTTSSASRTTCVTAAPLQEKVNPYADSYRGKPTTVTDESDCI